MKRFLMVTWDGGGNFPPEIGLVQRLAERGHDVRVMSHQAHASKVQEAGAIFRPYVHVSHRDSSSREDSTTESEWVNLTKTVLMNADFARDLLAEVDQDRPDAILVDTMTFTALIAAEQTGIPTVALWHTFYGAILASPMGQLMPTQLEAVNVLRDEAELPQIASFQHMVERAQVVLVFTYPHLDAVPEPLSPNVHYVGPMVDALSDTSPYRFPRTELADLPLVLVSFSTTFQRQVEGLQKVLDALKPLPVRVLVTLGPAVPANELKVPDNTVAEKFVAHGSVLPQASLVVTHAGHATVMAAVNHGVPMVCMPMGRDQHVVAGRVEELGLGKTVSVDDSPGEIRSTIKSVLGDEEIRRSAYRLRDTVDARAGTESAVRLLEALA